MRIFKFDEIDSTNTFLKNLENKEEFDLAITKKQSAGRGRRGNKWSSEEGAALFSIVLEDKKKLELEEVVKIPLVIGIAVLKGVEEYLNLIQMPELKNQLFFKWTNDLYYGEKKLAGILVEKVDKYFIAGIGINLTNKIDEEFQSKAISLRDVMEKEIDREEFILHVIKYVRYYFGIFLNGKWDEILKEINRKNLLKDREIEIHYCDSKIKGIGSDILSSGVLEVFSQGERRELSIGEVHLKI